MAKKNAYVLRAQGNGLLYETFSLHPHTKAEVASAMVDELERHGLDPKTGEERERWVKVMTIEFDDSAPSAGDVADATTIGKFDGSRLPPAQSGGLAAMNAGAPIEFSGIGHVENPK